MNKNPGRLGLPCPSHNASYLMCDPFCTAEGGRCRLVSRAFSNKSPAPIFDATVAANGFHPFINEVLPRQRPTATPAG